MRLGCKVGRGFKRRGLVLGGFLIGGICGVGCSFGVRVPSHPWERDPPLELHGEFTDEQNEIEFWEISVSELDRALAELEAEPIVSLAEYLPDSYWEEPGGLEGEMLFGVPVRSLPSIETLYLVRGIFLHARTGGFTVLQSGGHLCVRHDCFGGAWPDRIHESAVIVSLPSHSGEVWVFCEMHP